MRLGIVKTEITFPFVSALSFRYLCSLNKMNKKENDMIEYITGEVTDLTPATAVVECMGIGYLLNISLNTYSCLSKGQATRLYVYEAIREDAYQLYGFL